IRRWKIKDGQQQGPTMQAGSRIYSIVVSRDGQWIVSGDLGKVLVWNGATHQKVFQFPGHGGYAWAAAKFSPDGNLFATSSYDSGFRVYNAHDGAILFDSGPGVSINASLLHNQLAWSSDGQQLFIAGLRKIICLDVSKSLSSEWSIHQTHSRMCIASNGRFIACAAGLSVSLWDCVSHSQIGSIITYSAEIKCVAPSPSRKYLACG
ncbi:hypothetical protein PISMIDRAFT_72094, partial [Pisolithus microcarpus 441]